MEVCISSDDAIIVKNMYTEILLVFICEMWPSVPDVSVIEVLLMFLK